MTVCVVLEDQFGGELLKSLIKAKGLKQTRVFVGGNRSSAHSLATTLMVAKQLPVALILDSEVYGSERVERRRRELKAFVGATTSLEEWRLMLMVPELEIIFFQVPGLFEALGLPAPTPDQLKISEYVPRKVLEEIVTPVATRRGKSTPWRQWLMKRFSRLPHDELWKVEPFAELLRFLTSYEQDSEEAQPSRP